MNPTIELLERVRARTDTHSDYAVAHALGISRQRMSKLVNGHGELDDDGIITAAAEFVGDDPAATLARFRAAKAKSAKARAAWLRLERLALKSAAACLAVSVAAGATMSPPSPTDSSMATEGYGVLSGPTMYIM